LRERAAERPKSICKERSSRQKKEAELEKSKLENLGLVKVEVIEKYIQLKKQQIVKS
jgi:hypothetical protein